MERLNGDGPLKIPVLVLAGPTASGKTALAMEVALRLGTEIISADSAQVYRRLNIGTAKPTPLEQARVAHHLVDLIEPDREYSVAEYQTAAFKMITDFYQSGRIPFMVGGTGLYIKAVLDNYAFGEKGGNEELRRELADFAASRGLPALYQKLQKDDPLAAAAIHPNDERRIIRAMEVKILEGRPISDQVRRTEARSSPYDPLFFCLSMDRQQLYGRIEERADLMIKAGLLEETKKLLGSGFKPEDPGLQVIGYRQMAAFLTGRCSFADALADMKKQTRNYAKRQMTWFKRDRRIRWLSKEEHSFKQMVEIICTAVKELGC